MSETNYKRHRPPESANVEDPDLLEISATVYEHAHNNTTASLFLQYQTAEASGHVRQQTKLSNLQQRRRERSELGSSTDMAILMSSNTYDAPSVTAPNVPGNPTSIPHRSRPNP